MCSLLVMFLFLHVLACVYMSLVLQWKGVVSVKHYSTHTEIAHRNGELQNFKHKDRIVQLSHFLHPGRWLCTCYVEYFID